MAEELTCWEVKVGFMSKMCLKKCSRSHCVIRLRVFFPHHHHKYLLVLNMMVSTATVVDWSHNLSAIEIIDESSKITSALLYSFTLPHLLHWQRMGEKWERASGWLLTISSNFLIKFANTRRSPITHSVHRINCNHLRLYAEYVQLIRRITLDCIVSISRWMRKAISCNVQWTV